MNSTFSEKFCGWVSSCPLDFEYSIYRTLGGIYLNLQAQNLSHALLLLGFIQGISCIFVGLSECKLHWIACKVNDPEGVHANVASDTK